MPVKKLVLVGCGHASLQVLEEIAPQRHRLETQITVLTPHPQFQYYAMTPGILSEQLLASDGVVDIPALCMKLEVNLVFGAAVALRPNERIIEYTSEPGRIQELPFDFCVIDIGAQRKKQGLLTDSMLDHLLKKGEDRIPRLAFPLKPSYEVLRRVTEFEKCLSEYVSSRSSESATTLLPALHTVTVAGKGNSAWNVIDGFEMAFALKQRVTSKFSKNFEKLTFKIVHNALNTDVPSSILDECKKMEIDVVEDAEVIEIERTGNLVLSKASNIGSAGGVTNMSPGRARSYSEASVAGRRLPFHVLCWALDPAAQTFNACSDLSLSQDGFLRVDDALRSVDYPNVFCVGDCASVDSARDFPKMGSQSSKFGPVVSKNVLSSLRAVQDPAMILESLVGLKLSKFSPPKFSYVFSTSDGRAFSVPSKKWLPNLHNKMIEKMKETSLRKWMKRFSTLIATGQRVSEEESKEDDADSSEPDVSNTPAESLP
eukprot:ANDGO_08415.mRNA.1 hypothetical protein PTSG_03505